MRVMSYRSFFEKRVGLVVGLVCALLVVLASRGGFDASKADPQHGYYQRLSGAFVSGQLNLTEEVPLALLEASNPYDPVINAPFRTYGLHDSILKDGKFFYYWGPGAVVSIVIPAHFFGIEVTETDVGRYSLALFCIVCGLISDLLLKSRATKIITTATVSLSFSGLFLISRVAVWEAGVLFATAWIALAVLSIVRYLHEPKFKSLVLSALCVAFAVSSRLEAASLLIVPFLLTLKFAGFDWRRAFRQLVVILLPTAVVMALLLCYNFFRFGSFMEFGVRYLIGGIDQSNITFSSISYVPTNLFIYLLEPLRWTRSFPFLDLPNVRLADSSLGSLPGTEIVVGIAWTGFWILPLLALIAFGFKSQRRDRFYVTGLLLIGVSVIQTLFLSYAIFGASERYRVIPDFLIFIGVVMAASRCTSRFGLRQVAYLAMPFCIVLSLLGSSHGYYPDRVPQNSVYKILAGVTSPLAVVEGSEVGLDESFERGNCVFVSRRTSMSTTVSVDRSFSVIGRVGFKLVDEPWVGFGPLMSFGTPGNSDVVGLSWDGEYLKVMRDKWRVPPLLSTSLKVDRSIPHEIAVYRSKRNGSLRIFLDGVLVLSSDEPLIHQSLASVGVNSLQATTVSMDIPIAVMDLTNADQCSQSGVSEAQTFEFTGGCLSTWVETPMGLREIRRPLGDNDIALTLTGSANLVTDRRQPIVSSGQSGKGDVFSFEVASQSLSVFHDHWGQPLRASIPVLIEMGKGVRVAIVPSATSTLVLINGRQVLKTVALFDWDEPNWRLGVNDIGATTSAQRFEGVARRPVADRCS